MRNKESKTNTTFHIVNKPFVIRSFDKKKMRREEQEEEEEEETLENNSKETGTKSPLFLLKFRLNSINFV